MTYMAHCLTSFAHVLLYGCYLPGGCWLCFCLLSPWPSNTRLRALNATQTLSDRHTFEFYNVKLRCSPPKINNQRKNKRSKQGSQSPGSCTRGSFRAPCKPICQTSYCKTQVSAHAASSEWLCLLRIARDRQQKRDRGREDEERRDRCKIKSRHCYHLAERKCTRARASYRQGTKKKRYKCVTIFNGQASISLPIKAAPSPLLAFRPLIFLRLMAHVSCLLNEICFFSPSERFPPSNEITVVASFLCSPSHPCLDLPA
ncbi:hypothetical protein J3E68DRAFT_419296 [Trichoderma sp. SZMC 28012]